MSLRKFMHPRNRYRKAPDFKQLAVQYPEFRKVATVDLGGKVKIDFKNEETLRVLTEVLLKHDFNLNVQIPPNKLVPTLPLRLNYILWLEDLLTHAGFTEMNEIIGIDIGTGAVSIYPLLFANMYGSNFIASEIDESSVQSAVNQIQNNNLQHLIKVVKVNGETMLKDIIEEDKDYHFSMCNPPFFEVGDASETVTKKLPPRNAPTGNERELKIEGGERAFVTQMIEESIALKDSVKIYTTMIGRKTNLLYLIKFLKKQKVENLTWTEFCQGHTKRWGLAWTFLPKATVDLSTAPVIRKSGDFILKLLKDQRPLEIVFPLEEFSTFDDVIENLQKIIAELKMTLKEVNLPIDDFDGWACQLTADTDTWSHARRKRRLEQRKVIEGEKGTEDVSSRSDLPKSHPEDAESIIEKAEVKNPFLVCNFFVDVIEPAEDSGKNHVKICMVFEKGSGGKNSLETLRQYLLNKLNAREYFQKYCCKLSKKKRKGLKESKNDCIESCSESREATDEVSVEKQSKLS